MNAPEESKGYYTLGYIQFVVQLVQAVKEQQVIIEDLKLVNEVQRKVKSGSAKTASTYYGEVEQP